MNRSRAGMQPCFMPFVVNMGLERCSFLLHLTLNDVLAYKARIKYRSLRSIDVASNFSQSFILETESKAVLKLINAAYYWLHIFQLDGIRGNIHSWS